jgi:hypothetical protein
VVRFLIIAVLALTAVSCGGESATYSTEEAVDAFKRHGYTLVVRSLPGVTAAEREGDLLTPRGGEPFLVIVASDVLAEEAWPDYEYRQPRESFAARRANVLVISDSGLGEAERERVLAAMSSLPDRGAPAVIAGRG